MSKGFDIDLESLAQLEEKTIKAKETIVLLTPGEAYKSGTGAEIKKKFRLYGFIFTLQTESVILLKDGATVFLTFQAAAKTPVVFQYPKGGFLSATNGNKLQIEAITETKCTGTWYGIEDLT